MDEVDIQIALRRIHSDLERVFKSRGWLTILNQTQEPNALENSLGNALFFACEAKLKVNRILETQKHQKHKEAA